MDDQEAFALIDSLTHSYGHHLMGRHTVIARLMEFIFDKEPDIGCLWLLWATQTRQIDVLEATNLEGIIKLRVPLTSKFKCTPGKIHNVTDFVHATYLNRKYQTNIFVQEYHDAFVNKVTNPYDSHYFIVGEHISGAKTQFKSLSECLIVGRLFYCFSDDDDAVLFRLTHG